MVEVVMATVMVVAEPAAAREVGRSVATGAALVMAVAVKAARWVVVVRDEATKAAAGSAAVASEARWAESLQSWAPSAGAAEVAPLEARPAAYPGADQAKRGECRS